MARVTLVVLARIDQSGWPEHPGAAQPWDINRGRCVDWAELVCAAVPGAVMEEYDDGDMLHTFVVLDGRLYDAECPDGVTDATSLPCFQHPYARPVTS
jgi:hypothetical protein